MRNIITIATKEVKSHFVTPVAYVVITGFLLVSGFFFFTLLQQFNSFLHQAALMPSVTPSLNAWVVTPYYNTLEIILIFLVPILSMGALAEEKQRGTFELLVTSPLSISDIVFGKFLALAVVVLTMLSLSFVFPLVLIIFADPEVSPIFVGFLGVLLFTIALSSLGLAASAFSKSQMVAGVISFVSLLLFFVIDAPADKIGGTVGSVLSYLAPSGHAEGFLNGAISGTDVIYFFSIVCFGLFVANRVLETERQ